MSVTAYTTVCWRIGQVKPTVDFPVRAVSTVVQSETGSGLSGLVPSEMAPIGLADQCRRCLADAPAPWETAPTWGPAQAPQSAGDLPRLLRDRTGRPRSDCLNFQSGVLVPLTSSTRRHGNVWPTEHTRKGSFNGTDGQER